MLAAHALGRASAGRATGAAPCQLCPLQDPLPAPGEEKGSGPPTQQGGTAGRTDGPPASQPAWPPPLPLRQQTRRIPRPRPCCGEKRPFLCCRPREQAATVPQRPRRQPPARPAEEAHSGPGLLCSRRAFLAGQRPGQPAGLAWGQAPRPAGPASLPLGQARSGRCCPLLDASRLSKPRADHSRRHRPPSPPAAHLALTGARTVFLRAGLVPRRPPPRAMRFPLPPQTGNPPPLAPRPSIPGPAPLTRAAPPSQPARPFRAAAAAASGATRRSPPPPGREAALVPAPQASRKGEHGQPPKEAACPGTSQPQPAPARGSAQPGTARPPPPQTQPALSMLAPLPSPACFTTALPGRPQGTRACVSQYWGRR